MTKLSVNINKIATLRNARGGDQPNILQVAKDAQAFGAQGITVHPRPDERHITYQDTRELPTVITTEFNIEGNPIPKFVDMVCKIKPHQVTLVPDAPNAITSNSGWDTIANCKFLREVIQEFKEKGIRTSIFLDPDVAQVEAAIKTGTDRIELYTEAYAKEYPKNAAKAIAPFIKACDVCKHTLSTGENKRRAKFFRLPLCRRKTCSSLNMGCMHSHQASFS